jgi:hypothetical protein
LFESLKSYDNNLYLGLINGKEEDKKTIKALIVTIKDEELQDRGLEMFETRISAIIETFIYPISRYFFIFKNIV